MRNPAILFVLVALGAACGSSSSPAPPGTTPPAKPEPQGPFGPAAEGQGCSAGSDCSRGLFCLPILPARQGDADDVFAGHRCVSACIVDEHCPEGTCFAGTQVGSYGFCGHRRIQGESCSTARLSFCSATDSTRPLVCYPEDAGDGVCRLPCDPTAADPPCQAGEFCAGVFADPDLGICVAPDPAGVCDGKTRFCDRGQVCISAPSGTTSRCMTAR